MSNPEIYYLAIYKENLMEIDYTKRETKIGFLIKQDILKQIKNEETLAFNYQGN